MCKLLYLIGVRMSCLPVATLTCVTNAAAAVGRQVAVEEDGSQVDPKPSARFTRISRRSAPSPRYDIKANTHQARNYTYQAHEAKACTVHINQVSLAM